MESRTDRRNLVKSAAGGLATARRFRRTPTETTTMLALAS